MPISFAQNSCVAECGDENRFSLIGQDYHRVTILLGAVIEQQATQMLFCLRREVENQVDE